MENIAHHFSSGTFFWTDGTNCYNRLVKEKGRGSKKLVTWESYDEYNHLNNVNSLHSKMEGEGKAVPWSSGQVPSEILCALGESAFPFRHGSFRQGEKCTGPL